MARYVSLLRGINVGGHKKVPMAELREMHEGLGHRNIVSYIQSGNVVFDADNTSPSGLSSNISAAISDRFGFDIPIIIRSPEQLALALANSPFGDDDAEPKWRFIAFLSATPQQTGVDGEVFAPDIFTVAGDHVHVLLPSGSAKSKLKTNYLEKVLGVEATLRNHNTVSKIVGLC